MMTTKQDLLLDYIIKQKTKVLKYTPRQSISLSSVDNALHLSCEQEEADTRILRHCQYILNIQKDAYINIGSLSDDNRNWFFMFSLRTALEKTETVCK